MNPQQWQALQPLLDQALDTDSAGRAALLAGLQAQDAALAAELERLLAQQQQLHTGGFLHGSLDAASALRSRVAPGQRLGPWRVLAPIGEGGMGSVWRARRDDGLYDAEVAIKLLAVSLAGVRQAERFRREGRILARLAHPHIARLLDAGVTDEGQPFLVLEHVSGQHIDRHCDERRLGLRERVRLLLALAEALEHAHRQLVVHRDIKPSNVMVDDEGRVKLLDFGIAKLLTPDSGATDTEDAAGADDTEPLTQRLGAVHTPGYAAPEQLLRGEVSTATDVYAFGALACLLLSGQHPTLRPGASAAQTLKVTLDSDAPRLSQLARGGNLAATAAARNTAPAALLRALRGDLDTIVAKALRRDSHERYAGAAALAEDLRRHLAHQPIHARPPSLAYVLRRWVQRQPLLVGGGAMAAVAVAALGLQLWQQQRAADDSRTQALAVEGLLASVFHGLDPTVAAQRSFSAPELLDRAQAYLDQQGGLDAETQRAVRLRLAGLYRDVGAYPQALRGFEAEAAAAAAAGEGAAQEQALWQAASVAVAQRDWTRSEALLAALDQTLARTATPLPGAAARLALLRGELALGQLRLTDAQATLAQASAGLAATTDLELQARLAHAQGMAARLADDTGAALLHLKRAAALQSQRGERGLIDGLSVALEIGALENRAGRHAASAEVVGRAHPKLLARLGPHHGLTVAAVAELAQAELRQGRFAEVERWTRLLRGRSSDADAWRDDHADLLQALALLYGGQARAAEPELKRLLAAMERDEGGVSLATEPLRRLHGEALLRLNRNAEAEAVLRRTEAEQRKLPGGGPAALALTQVLLAVAEARRGELTTAGPRWRDAAQVLAQTLGGDHPQALLAAAYAALLPGMATPAERQALATRLQPLLWQDGAAALAALLREPGPPRSWAALPVAL
jgi:eukaryotic-like serine/threonine-protein kinase